MTQISVERCKAKYFVDNLNAEIQCERAEHVEGMLSELEVQLAAAIREGEKL